MNDMGRLVSIDTNLLILWVVGTAAREYIKMHPRLKSYDKDDFDDLVTLLYSYDDIILTPHVLAETSNLIGKNISNPALKNILVKFKEIIVATREDYVHSVQAAKRKEFFWLGLTDVVLLQLLAAAKPQDQITLVSVDANLVIAAEKANCLALNFKFVPI